MKSQGVSGTSADKGLGRGMRVLIVDDVRDTVLTLGILLRSEGFRVELVQSGSAVPEAVKSFRPSAILLDIGMPDRNGFEVAAELTKKYGVACPTLIALTASDTYSDRVTAKESGFKYFIAKPYDPSKLLEVLGSIAAPIGASKKDGLDPVE